MEKRKSQTTRSFYLFEKYGIENCQIILLENVSATNYEELVAREAYYIRTLLCVNHTILLRTKPEYYKHHKEEISEWQKAYYKENKDFYQQYRDSNKEQIREHNNKNITKPIRRQ